MPRCTRQLPSTSVMSNTDSPQHPAGSTVAVVVTGSLHGESPHRKRHRPGSQRGTSLFLGVKAGNPLARAKRLRWPAPIVKRWLEPLTMIHDSSRPSLLPLGIDATSPALYHGYASAVAAAAQVPRAVPRAPQVLSQEVTDLEARLEALTHELEVPEPPPSSPMASSSKASQALPNSPPCEPFPDEPDVGVLGEPNRRWDAFGRDGRTVAQASRWLELLCRYYFRLTVSGIEHIPSEGRCLVVANHSGSLPIDGLILQAAVRSAHPAHRELRWLTEDFIQELPYLGTWFSRLGAVRASHENAERLLRAGCLVGAFPEGVKGYAKPFSQHYRLQRFGRGGIVQLCLRTRTPLVPCAILGAEEASPSLRRLEAAERIFKMPFVPVTFTFPWLGPLGLVPAPTRWHIEFGAPVYLEAEGPSIANDPLRVAKITERVRETLQLRIDQLLKEKKRRA